MLATKITSLAPQPYQFVFQYIGIDRYGGIPFIDGFTHLTNPHLRMHLEMLGMKNTV